jgi:hypothetical protein
VEQYIGNAVVGIILLVLGFLLNQVIQQQFTQMNSRFDCLENELKSIRDMLTGKIIDHTDRLVRLEEKDKK